MASVRRRIFSLASLLSLALFLATAVLWIRSYLVNDRYQHVVVPAAGQAGCPANYVAVTFKGEIVGMTWVVDPPRPNEPPFMQDDYEQVRRDFEKRGRNPTWTTSPPHKLDADLRWGGFGYSYSSVESNIGRSVFVPLWAPMLLFLVLPMFWLIARGRAVRTRNRCTGCGYNLTGNISGVCPECGTPVHSSRTITETKSPQAA